MPNMLETIKQVAVEAVKASNPVAIIFGKVTQESPLKINIEQRLTLDAEHLILSSLVQDFSVDVTLDHSTDATSGGTGESSFSSHSHTVAGKKTMVFHFGLKVGETVMLLQIQGGQKFLILDRVR